MATQTPQTTTFKVHQVIVIGLVFYSFFMSALVSRTVFERLPHLEDELAYLFQARIFARGDVVVDIPQPRNAYWQPFLIDYAQTGSRFGKYTPGWPAMLTVGIVMGQAWIINAFFAGLTVAVVYRLGGEIFNPDVGVIAAALTAFSPMALLLNATLMGHTAALFCFTLFMYAFWRMERPNRAKPAHNLRWAALAGTALGLVVINRPLAAVGVGLPFILWSGLRVAQAIYTDVRTGSAPQLSAVSRILPPLMVIAIITLMISAAIPMFSYAVTGDPFKNLYVEVWEYDRVGFGACCGRSSQNNGAGHTIIKGVQHARFDLSLTAADLFGWQAGEITPELQQHLRTESDYWPVIGLSYLLLPLGLMVGFRDWQLRTWVVVGMAWLVVPLLANADFLLTQPAVIWMWLAVFAVWVCIPPVWFIFAQKQVESMHWTWLLLAVPVGLIGVHLAYWVGSQRYSTRYYFEALTALAILSALPLAWLAQRWSRAGVYTLLAIALMWSLYAYSTPRIDALYGFNGVSWEVIEQIEARREGNRPVLVIVTGQTGTVSWRSRGSLMAVTNPYLDSDIVMAWDFAPGTDIRRQIIARFPDRQIIDMEAIESTAWFVDADID